MYVNTGQVMSSRVDVFPQQYIERLQKLQDSLEPIPFEVVASKSHLTSYLT
jgi:predicted unusual protein kinase regulating ubiquinone biosynthesis (AarF/ABC1/UbiB family)